MIRSQGGGDWSPMVRSWARAWLIVAEPSSDEEALELEELPSSDEDEDEDEDDDDLDQDAAKGDASDGEEDDYGQWGSSRKAYYDANDIEDEADAEEEEAEVRRILAKNS